MVFTGGSSLERLFVLLGFFSPVLSIGKKKSAAKRKPKAIQGPISAYEYLEKNTQGINTFSFWMKLVDRFTEDEAQAAAERLGLAHEFSIHAFVINLAGDIHNELLWQELEDTYGSAAYKDVAEIYDPSRIE